ncbi:DUF6850 family outer membrane beta-barrel protein [Chitinophaga sp. sic0106]|uniref:DUF6850 family outer membrane beta-barrel protein n=1 Tax=Chitinophaga sp. sic0106 TaxID=2854785 RepID=UPI001C47AA26|nr:DUF6850 family outer membrane beta-barrel protein [Chitinophaga sp. sic0106]MBV7533078.1 hypothetical protein [Chitinophaga sp. sic0106]
MKKLYITMMLVAAGGAAVAQSQNTNTPASYELRQQRSLWEQSGNPAGLKLDRPYQFSTLKAGYEGYDGDFRRPQEGASGNRQLVETAGGVFLDSFYLSGKFSYRREQVKDAKFNASIIDPFRGMPYIIADLNPSDWIQQHYNLQFQVASPTYGRWSWGLGGSYNASSGAKQRDIRTENYYYAITVTPGVVYSISPKHHVGLNATYKNTKEEASMKNVNTYVDQVYYELFGLGTAVSQLGSGRTNNYEGDSWGGGLQYQYKGNVTLLANLNYLVEAEDLIISFTTPRDGGSVLRKLWQAGIGLQKESDKLLHTLQAQYYNRHIDGIQYVTQRDNSSAQQGWVTLAKYIRSTYKTQELGLNYSITGKKGHDDYSWKADFAALYSKLNDEYILPHSWKNTENVYFQVGGKKNFSLGGDRESRLLVGLRAGYNRNLNGSYQYNGQHPEYPTVTELETNDYRYLASDFVRFELPLTYSLHIGKDNKRVLFVNAYGRYTKANSFDFNNRYTYGGSVGVNF